MKKRTTEEKVALRWRRTKIVATLGPASSSPPVIEQLIGAGVDVVRLNMSHGNHDGHRTVFSRVREAAARMGRHVGIMVDLSGPKIRTGTFPGGGIELNDGEEVIIDSRIAAGKPGLIPSQYRSLHKDVKPRQRILLDDGNIELAVLRVAGTQVRCNVVHGGTLKDHKGINLPDSKVSAPSLTAKDKKDALFAAELGADYLALSFVRRGQDVLVLRRLLLKAHASIPIISKIEKPEAMEHIGEILAASDGIMVARGDLGIEMPAESVPLIQRDLIRLARDHAIPVIVATQMLESMITHSRATRAEVGDVANAALLGADGVMLSAETASGKYPIEAVRTMDRIVREIEAWQWKQGALSPPAGMRQPHENQTANLVRDAIAHAASMLAADLKLQGILIPTQSGTTARVLSAYRPAAPLVAVPYDDSVCRRLALCWGVVPVMVPESKRKDWNALAATIAVKCELTRTGNHLLIVSGFSDDPLQNEPVMKVVTV